jgi:cephalosporin-C deacetylase
MTHQSVAQPLAHDYEFDPTYGYDLEALLEVSLPPAPDDFDDFWRDRYRLAREVDVAPRLLQLENTVEGANVFEVKYRSVDDIEAGGWLVVPEGPIECGLVIGHGYGGRAAPDLPLAVPNAAAIYPCARGIGDRSRLPSIPADPMEHVLHGVQARETYVHAGCVADLWCAATALAELVPAVGERLGYVGLSFGGGIGALAMPWDERFKVAHFTLPGFGHHPLRLTMPCVGSGKAVRRYAVSHPEVFDVLQYFDAATAASRIDIPVQIAAALFDPAVPPPGQFAIHNALAGPRDLIVLSAGHFTHSGIASEHTALIEARDRFLASHL